MATLDYANTRYSPLDQIRGDNIGNLRVEFTFSTGINRGQEAAPIVVGDTMVTHMNSEGSPTEAVAEGYRYNPATELNRQAA